MKDEKGSLYIIEAILAITILLMAIFVVNTVISIPSPDYSFESHDLKSAQDIMESLSGKIYSTDQTFLSEISVILKENKNSKKSIREVSDICQSKCDSFKGKNYNFCENGKLKGKLLAYKGDYDSAYGFSTATRTYGVYSYTLYVWQ